LSFLHGTGYLGTFFAFILFGGNRKIHKAQENKNNKYPRVYRVKRPYYAIDAYEQRDKPLESDNPDVPFESPIEISFLGPFEKLR
jgi:hypothetical protein